MIYTVECSFTHPAKEEEWNNFYSQEKLPALISVSGFHTSQRFKAISEGCPTYLAIHTIDSPAILQSDEYYQKGGGNFARWQPYITDWHRYVYDGIDLMPNITQNDYLLLTNNNSTPFIDIGLDYYSLHTMEKSIYLAKLTHPCQINKLPTDIFIYRSITKQLTKEDCHA